MGMSSSSLILCLLLLAANLAVIAGAKNEYKVGDGDGWRVPADNDPDFYETWASKIKFIVGDSIVFDYHNDSVAKVSKRGYYHCNETSKTPTLKDGSTVIVLDKLGFYYFVSGDVEHCEKGQRLMVEVAGLPLVPTPSPDSSSASVASCSVLSAVTAVGFGAWWVAVGFSH
ncbi:uncharacterized protein A4U43_C06F12250 [Asparagus officinalis]|uniref:Phytocyanin domain-containing protein n=1 Tax=Asparagus officinalis TaxID=4686 RepID=A0A5P1EM03_ASPOF|nr:stellacyanin-like [Asparagus officinalis]ONK66814.1 uncharacterized protein A4U43_C06F12250 [Asparagus officinalis]